MQLTIRPATVDDASAIVAILNPIIETGRYTAFDTPFSVQAEREFIANLPERGIFHVAEWLEDGRILGFQTLTPFADYTRAFAHVGVMGTFVDLNHHRRGIASHLFAVTCQVALSHGYKKIFTYVRSDNQAGLAAYKQQGFRAIGVADRQVLIGGRYIDEIIIEKWLA
jgi:L-amino acid N-acyltransferase YncA